MKKFTAFLTAFVFATQCVTPALAALTEPDRAQITIRQRLINPGFESGLAGWTASTTAHLSAITSGVGSGNASAQWAPTAAGETLASGYVTISSGDGLSGANGVVSCRIKTVSGTGLPTIESFDGTNKLVSQAVTSTTTGYTRTSANFIFPASGTVRLQFTSVTSPATIAIDDCYLGLADGYNFAQVSQAKIYGSLKYDDSGSCFWQMTTTTAGSYFPANASCPTPTTSGSVTAPATKTPTMLLNNAPPGDYYFSVGMTITHQVSASTIANYGLYEANTTTKLDNRFVQVTTATNPPSFPVTLFGRYVQTTAGNLDIRIGASASSGSVTVDATNGFRMVVYYFPSSSQTAYSANQQSTPLVHVLSGSGSLVTTQGASWLRVRMVGGGGGGAGAGTSAVAGTAGTQTTFGTLTANGGNAATSGTGAGAVSTGTIGADWNGKVIASNGGGAGGNSTGAGTYPIGGVGGGSGIFGGGGASNATNSGSAGAAASGGGGAGAGSPTQGHVAGGGGSGGGGIDAITVGAPLSSYSYSVGGGGSGGVGGDTTGSAGGSGTIEVTEYFGAVNNPIFIGSVTSNTSGQERIERVAVNTACSSSPCTITSQTGSWVPASGITRSGTGSYTLTWTTGMFSAAPTCQVSAVYTGGIERYCQPRVASSSSLDILCMDASSSTGTVDDAAFNISCTGPR
jgi:hypothetical protein